MFNHHQRASVAPVKRRRRKTHQAYNGRSNNRAESIAELVTKMKAGESNLLVISRIRPMADAEVLKGATETARVLGEKVVVLLDPATDTEDVLRKNRSREKRYAFDHAFGPEASQTEVYETSCKFLLRGVLEGYNATVFAYGPTGAGKTFTMTGSESDPGIMTRSISDLFRLMNEDTDNVQYSVAINYVEIYNECIRDLLVRGSPDLDLREDSDGNSVVCGVNWVEIEKADQISRLLREGNLRRTQEATRANMASSRSHAILEVRVQRSSKSAGDQTVQTGRLHMIDLAGSERAASTGNHGQRMVEGQHINRSLLALGNCINALGSGGNQKYVNFRDSKLTRILKESLGGNCRTVMIACASPASIHFEETYNTMNYANRAKNIKTAAVKNTTVVEAHIVEFGQIVERLKAEVTFLRAKLKAAEQGGTGSVPTSPRAKSAERSIADLSRRYDALIALEEKLQTLILEEASIDSGSGSAVASASPGRAKRDIQESRALVLQEIEAEKVAIARLTASLHSNNGDGVESRPHLRHLESQHKLRLAHLSQGTELRLVRMAATDDRELSFGLRDRVIERQRTLLGGALETIPEDLVEMYRELGALRSREARRSAVADGAGPAVTLPHLPPAGGSHGGGGSGGTQRPRSRGASPRSTSPTTLTTTSGAVVASPHRGAGGGAGGRGSRGGSPVAAGEGGGGGVGNGNAGASSVTGGGSSPLHWGEAPVPNLHDPPTASAESSSEAEHTSSVDDDVTPAGSSPPLIRPAHSATRSERGVNNATVTIPNRASYIIVDGDRRVGGASVDATTTASMRRARGGRNRGVSTMPMAARQAVPSSDGSVTSMEGTAPCSNEPSAPSSQPPPQSQRFGETFSMANDAPPTTEQHHLGETYSMGDFQNLISGGGGGGGGGASSSRGSLSSGGGGSARGELRRTYSKAVPTAGGRASPSVGPVSESNRVRATGAAGGQNLPELAVVTSSVPSSTRPDKTTTSSPHMPRRAVRRNTYRTKPSVSKARPSNKKASISSTSPYGLRISSSPYAPQSRKPRGVR
eukprot:m.86153 g.86153  ORF g.86153 m.86153 type:complete len:1042 (-) comp9657_c1_seq2:69-3194(-)